MQESCALMNDWLPEGSSWLYQQAYQKIGILNKGNILMTNDFRYALPNSNVCSNSKEGKNRDKRKLGKQCKIRIKE